MPRVHTHYDNLKVARNAPLEVIRAAYKTLSQKYHPDRNPGPDAVRVIQLINAAYEVLSDPVKRQQHDEWIAREESGDGKSAANKSIPTSAQAPKSRHKHHRRSTRHRSSPVYGYYGHSSWAMNRLFQKVRMFLNHFSRSLFRKT